MDNATTDVPVLNEHSEMARLIAVKDWSQTSLGHPAQWPQSLHNVVSLMIENPFGMYVAWGSEYTALYNDGFRPILGTQLHPSALGALASETFADIWPTIGPMFGDVMTGKAHRMVDLKLLMNRNGFTEECYFDFAYSPIRQEDGTVGGVLVTVIETTEKVKAITAVKESEERFRMMAEGSDILIAISDETSNATYFNKAWTKLTGRSTDDLLNFGWADLIHIDDRQQFLDIYLRAFEQKQNWTGQFRMQDRNGNWRWLLANGATRHHADGTFTGYFSSSVDITDQVTSMKMLEESELNIRNTVLEAPIGICILDAATLCAEIVNESFIEIAGKPHEDIVGKYYWDTFSEARPYYEPALKRVVEEGTIFRADEVAVTLVRHGREDHIYVTFVYAPLKNNEGEVKKVAIWVLENTQQVLSRNKVEQSEQEIRALIESAPFPIGVYKGREMRVAFANQSIMDIWGKGSDVIGKLFSEVLPELDNQEVFKQLDNVFTTGIPFHIKNQRLDLLVNGKERPYYFNYSLTPLFDADGQVYGAMNTGDDVTELNLAKQEVEQSERNFRSMVLQAPVAMCILLGPSHTVEVANEFMIELWGKKAGDVMGKPIFEALPDAADQGLEQIMANVYLNSETFKANERPVELLRNGKKEIVYQNFVYEPYRDADGATLGILAISVNVTEQVLARRKIEEAEEKARLAINSAELGFYEIIFATDEMFTDKRFKEIWGIDKDHTYRSEYIAVLHPDDMKMREEAHATSLRTGYLNYETRIIWNDGSVRWARITGKVIYDEKETPLKLIGVAQDITASVTAQQKIENSERNIRTMILQSPVAMCIFRGPSYVVEIANNKMLELWGKEPMEVMNKPIFEGLPEVREQGLEAVLAHVMSTGERFEANERPVDLPRKNKIETIYINFAYEQMRSAEGDVTGILAVAVDVTEQVLARHKIEEIVTDRTKELADVNDSLKRSNAELAQFAYIASHDLQEPIRKISIYSEMLKQAIPEIDGASAQYIDKIGNSTQRMQMLIRDVLAYSQLSKEVVSFERVDLQKIAEQTIADFDLLIAQKEAVVTFGLLPTIEAIPIQMSQLFGNIISNALKYSRNDITPVVSVRSRTLSPEDVTQYLIPDELRNYYIIEFTDNGIGFEPEYAEKMFNIFQRLHGKKEYAGTGIGLAMCKKIAQNHNGEIYATVNPAGGAIIKVIIPGMQNPL